MCPMLALTKWASRASGVMTVFLLTAARSAPVRWTEVRGVWAGVLAAEAVLFFLEEEEVPLSLKKVIVNVCGVEGVGVGLGVWFVWLFGCLVVCDDEVKEKKRKGNAQRVFI